MWPFNSNNGKDTSEIAEELPDNLKGFFKENNPDLKHETIFDVPPQQKRVNEILHKHQKNNEYSFEFDKYKRRETPKKVTSINCAELQQKVIECFRGWTFTLTNQCSQEIKNNSSCIEIQNNALKKLYYDDCYNIDHCTKIRFVIDKLFIDNFGQYGENMTDESKHKFNEEIDKAFYKIWK
ncbi:unnamed protein product [Debaryomyces tyrocola]|nr:unnamed protein product [Debaryomyces tyrocola]